MPKRPDPEKTQRLEVAGVIGWQLYGADHATHIELEQWEKCVRWAQGKADPSNKPYVPTRVCITYQEYVKICRGGE